MAVDVGTAKGYLDLDISGFLKGLKSAQTEADTASKNIATKLGNNLSSAGQKLESAGKSLTKSVTVPIVGIGAAICTGIGAAAAVTKKLIDKNNNSGEDVVKDEEPEFEDGESDDSTENSTETTDSTETN